MAQILYSRGLWGMPEADLETQCKRIADGGFDAVEAFIPFGERAWQESLATAAGAAGLRIVAQFHTRREHLEEALERVDRGVAEVLDLDPLLINCHSGSGHAGSRLEYRHYRRHRTSSRFRFSVP